MTDIVSEILQAESEIAEAAYQASAVQGFGS